MARCQDDDEWFAKAAAHLHSVHIGQYKKKKAQTSPPMLVAEVGVQSTMIQRFILRPGEKRARVQNAKNVPLFGPVRESSVRLTLTHVDQRRQQHYLYKERSSINPKLKNHNARSSQFPSINQAQSISVQRPKPSKTETEYIIIAPMLYAEDIEQ